MDGKALATSLLLLFTVVACGGGSSSDPIALVDLSEIDAGIDFGDGSPTELEGRWVKLCSLEVQGNSTYYSIVSTSFSGKEFSTVIESFTDSGCTQPISNIETIWGEFLIEAAMTSLNGAPVTGIVSGIGKSQQTSFYRAEYNIYSLSTGSLYFGAFTNDYNGSTKALRPMELEYTRIFQRVVQ